MCAVPLSLKEKCSNVGCQPWPQHLHAAAVALCGGTGPAAAPASPAAPTCWVHALCFAFCKWAKRWREKAAVGAQVAQSSTHLPAAGRARRLQTCGKYKHLQRGAPASLTVQCIFVFNCSLLSCLASPAQRRLGAHGWWCLQHMAVTDHATESTWAWESDGFTAWKWGTETLRDTSRSCAKARPGPLSPALASEPCGAAEGDAFGGKT